MIYKSNGSFVISTGKRSLPGSYESERAARYAFKFSYEILDKLQDKANQRNGGKGGVISLEDLQKERSRK